MILSTKIKPIISVGPQVGKILSLEYLKDKDGKHVKCNTGEKGLECKFFLMDYNAELSFIFWLREEAEYQLKNLYAAANFKTLKGALKIKELIGKIVWVVVQQELTNRDGEIVSDITGQPIKTMRIGPKFFPFIPDKRPVVEEDQLSIVAYWNKGQFIYERNVI
jgi:hypothetical protein